MDDKKPFSEGIDRKRTLPIEGNASSELRGLSPTGQGTDSADKGSQTPGQSVKEQPVLEKQDVPAPAEALKPSGHVEQSGNTKDAVQPKGKWLIREVSSDLARHDYMFATQFRPESNRDVTVVGASVRGRLKKHEGRNRDDWFETGSVNGWTIIAVADGLGSREFSRVGAKITCRAAANKLKETLSDVSLYPRQTHQEWLQALTKQQDNAFFGEDIDRVAKAFIGAIDAAYNGLVMETEVHREDQEYIALLGTAPTVNDYSTTLLLAVHNAAVIDDKPYDFIMSLQVGDGRVVAMNSAGEPILMGKALSGSHAGQVVPLTADWVREPAELQKLTQVTSGQFKALMVMTDGVSDIYFPHKTEMQHLYSDLIEKGIIGDSSGHGETKEGDDSGKPDVILRDWLDTYEVRGEFDDRTLVVLYRELAQ